jgi:hypothetical protein
MPDALHHSPAFAGAGLLRRTYKVRLIPHAPEVLSLSLRRRKSAIKEMSHYQCAPRGKHIARLASEAFYEVIEKCSIWIQN